jgi:lysophospholipase L1-like esterase
MRRFLFWYLPVGAALLAGGVFAFGFVTFLRGDIGTPVDIAPVVPTAVAAAPTSELVPIVLGDSLARGTGDPSGRGIPGHLDDELRARHLHAKRALNLGMDGARTADLLKKLETPSVRRLIAESNVIVVSVGGNDLWGGADWRTAAPPNPDAVMNDVLGRIEKVIATIRALNPRARIFFIGLYNPFAATPAGKLMNTMVNRWNGRLLATFGSDPNFSIVQTADLFTHRDRLALDRFHPNGEAYELIARRIADAV